MAQVFTQVLLPIILAFIMLVMGMGLTTKDFKRVVSYPKAFALGLFLQMLLLPILALFITWAFNLSFIAAAGLFLVSLAPGGATSNLFSALAKADVALSVSLTAVNSLLVPFTLPMCFGLYLAMADNPAEQFDLPIVKMMMQLVVITLIPVLVGMLLRHKFTASVTRLHPLLTKLSGLSLLVVILLIISTNWDVMVKSVSINGAAALMLAICGFAIGYFIAKRLGLEARSVKTVSIEVGLQNAGTAMMVALVVLQQPELAAIPMMYGLLMNIPAFSFVGIANYQERKVSSLASE